MNNPEKQNKKERRQYYNGIEFLKIEHYFNG